MGGQQVLPLVAPLSLLPSIRRIEKALAALPSPANEFEPENVHGNDDDYDDGDARSPVDVGGPTRLHDLAEENARLKDQLHSLEGAMRELIEDHERDDELQRGRVELEESDESDPEDSDDAFFDALSDDDLDPAAEFPPEPGRPDAGAPAFQRTDRRPLFPDARVSVFTAVLHLFDWKLGNLITDAAFAALLTLLCYVLLPAGHLLPTSLYLCEKTLGADDKRVQEHACVNEDHLFPALARKEWLAHVDDQCPKCHERRFDSHLRPRNPFYSFPIIPQLRVLYGEEEFCRLLDEMASVIATKPSADQSFFGGSLVQNISGPDAFLGDPRHNLVLSAGTDGVQCFIKGNREVWVLSLRIRNLPPRVNTNRDYRLQAAIFSPSKRVDPYVERLFEEIDSTYTGVQVKSALGGEMFLLKLRLLTLEADHMGMCFCGCFAPPSSYMACWVCWIMGHANPDTKHGSYFGGYINGSAWRHRKRTDEETRRLGAKASAPQRGDPECEPSNTGINGASPFVTRCRDFDAVWSFAPEPFHAIYEVNSGPCPF